MKKTTLFKTLIFMGAVVLDIFAIFYLPHSLIYLVGCWQLGGWMGSLAGKVASRIK